MSFAIMFWVMVAFLFIGTGGTIVRAAIFIIKDVIEERKEAKVNNIQKF